MRTQQTFIFREQKEEKGIAGLVKKFSFQQHSIVHSKEQKPLVFMYYCIIGKYLQIAYVLENFSAQIIEVPIHKMQIITSFTMLLGIQKESIFLRTWCSTKVDT